MTAAIAADPDRVRASMEVIDIPLRMSREDIHYLVIGHLNVIAELMFLQHPMSEACKNGIHLQTRLIIDILECTDVL